MKILFWIFFFSILYCYFGYPLALILLARLKARPVKKAYFFPSISVLLSVCNEEDVIERKIHDLLEMAYPSDKIEILIGSDGSTDETVATIKKFSNTRVKLFASSERRGKMATINDLVTHAQNQILVMTDARQVFAPDAVKELVANFSDPTIGCVSGELMFHDQTGATAEGVGLYWKYEKFLRQKESALHSMLGATGAIYALRRELFSPAPVAVVLDDVYVPVKIILKGYRAVFEPKAKAYDHIADNPQEEHRRKARTLYGNYQIFAMLPEVFHPGCSPIALQMFSHKFLRLLIPFFMIALFILNCFLLNDPFFKFVFFCQILFYVLAAVGALAEGKNCGIFKDFSKFSYIPYVFCLLNFSALTGFFRFIGAKQQTTWEKARDKRYAR